MKTIKLFIKTRSTVEYIVLSIAASIVLITIAQVIYNIIITKF